MTSKTHQKITRALQDLQNERFDVSALWREFSRREEEYERGTPGVEDTRYTLPSEKPTIGEHFAYGDALPSTLDPARMWEGYHYTLTAGQREWFRENTALTPSQTVTLAWVEKWPGTMHPRAFKVVSDVHIDPRHRKHVLNEYVVRNVGAFFRQSAENDARIKEESTLQIAVGRVNVWRPQHRRAVETLTGVILEGDKDCVEITMVSDTLVCFQDLAGNKATVSRDEFLSEVADYTPGESRKGKSPTKVGAKAKDKERTFTKDLSSLMDDLEKNFPE